MLPPRPVARLSVLFVTVLLAAAGLVVPATWTAGDVLDVVEAAGPGEGRIQTHAETMLPRRLRDLRAASRPEPAQTARLRGRLLLARERAAQRAAGAASDDEPGPRQGRGRPVAIAETFPAFHGNPADISLTRNLASLAAIGPNARTLASPVAVNDGQRIFYAGNTHAEVSPDGAATFDDIVLPAGPANAPIPCCLPDVAHDRARGVTFWSLLYLDAPGNTGVVRIFVRRSIIQPDNCAYDVDLDGSANNLIPDFPRLALSTNALYLATNNVDVARDRWAGAQVRRFNLDQLADCAEATVDVLTLTDRQDRQRVLTPVDGALDTMYLAVLQNQKSLRVFRWPEGSTRVTGRGVSVAPASYADPDCRGGVNNQDWLEGAFAPSLVGFDLRGAVGAGRLTFLWPVGPDRLHPQAHVHAAVLRESDFKVLNQPHLFHDTLCLGLPAIAPNDRGDLGLTIAAGGTRGGGGPAVKGFIGIDDDFTPGPGNFPIIFLTANATHNPADERFGDYFSIRRHNPCGLFWVATNYGLNTGTDVGNVNARYLEFGRNRDRGCWAGS